MKTALAILIASTALTVSIAVPAWSATEARAANEARPLAALVEVGPDAQPVIFASSDDDDDDDDRQGAGRGDDDEEGEEDDDDDGGSAMANPLPAGAVAPPTNGLFGNSAPPKVQVN